MSLSVHAKYSVSYRIISYGYRSGKLNILDAKKAHGRIAVDNEYLCEAALSRHDET